ncbi:FtsX-like permease family protein [Roseivivax sediminis]|uniref:Putative ABC transport system permease protein n=1 Tax=Roseivivax sediminis TaxID=936889 RepID=A0A1I1YRR0_9RHOB|nr:FtsX-like permease family protein [Roseivivax sediminis]SFE22119.1 putative ABC transport system permease protein [Roseivivax sediminis]
MTRAAILALLSHWRRQPLQLAMLLIGLALATALWSGVQAINAEARSSYDRAAATLGQDTLDRLSRPGGATLEDFVTLRRAGWLVSPVIEGRIAEPARLQILGVDPLTAPPQAGLSALAGDGDILADFLGPGLLLVAPETAAELEGSDLPPRRIAPDLAPGIAVTDITTAQALLDRERLSYLTLAPEQPFGLPPLESVTDLSRSTPEDGTDLAELTDSFHLNLTAFGLLAFGVGLFIVQSAIGLAFEQRRQTFRTLRALGLPLRRLVLLLAAELAGFALIAGTLGLALGYAIAAALLPGVAGTLRGLYGAPVSGVLDFDPVWALAGLGITLAGTALAGAQALWTVARMPLLAPAQPRAWAMASARMLTMQGVAAGLLLALALGLTLTAESLIAAFASLAALLLGAALALPPLLIAALRAARPLARGPVGEWLLADARQQVPALSLALMALLLALAANVGVGTMVGSFRTTFTGWLDQRLAAELYVTAPDEATAARARAIAAEDARAVLPTLSTDLDVLGRPATLVGVPDAPTYREDFPLIDAAPDAWDRVADGSGILVNEQLYRGADLSLGNPLRLSEDWQVPVAGVYADYGNPAGEVRIGLGPMSERYPDLPLLRFSVRIDPEDAPALADRLRQEASLPDQAVVNQAEVKAISLRVFEQTFLVTGALNVLTLGVAGIAVLTSLLTLSSLRLPQLAPLWALGMRPGRLARLDVARTLLLALLTWVLSVPVGLTLAWVLLAKVNVAAFGWRLPMLLFPGDWLWLGLAALAAAGLACLWPALRLTRLPPSRLLRIFANDR